MGKAMFAALSMLGLTSVASAEVVPDWAVLKISRVQVETNKSDNTPWDLKTAEEPNGCPLVGLAGKAVLGPAGGAVATFLCTQSPSKQRERDPQAPDLYVSVSVGDTKFRTAVAPDTTSEVFDFPIVLPIEAVPAVGITIQVLDLDRDVNAGQLIGMLRVSKKQIQEALSSQNAVIEMSDDRVKKIEFEVTPYEASPAPAPFTFAVNQSPTATTARVRAGELVTVKARGTFGVRSNSENVGPAGYPGGSHSGYNLKPDFERANHASAIAYVNDPKDSHSAFVVGECATVVSPLPGRLYVGINDADASNNTGSVAFDVNVGLPTVEQWRTGATTTCTVPRPSSFADETTLTPDAVLKKIQQAYMTKIRGCYTEYLKIDSSARGKVTLSFTVDGSGKAIDQGAKGFARALDQCIASQMNRWTFPVPKNRDERPTSAPFAITLSLEP